jgi:short-subunit dehydrogenase
MRQDEKTPTAAVTRRFTFAAAHRYARPEWSEAENRAHFGPLATIHGHTYTLEVTVRGPIDPRTGMVMDLVSLAAVRAIPGCAAYTASKAGVLGLVRTLAAEVRGRGVRVTAVCPGAVDTPFWDEIPSPPDRSRMLRPEAVAEAALLAAPSRPRRSWRRSSSPPRRGCSDPRAARPPVPAWGMCVGYNGDGLRRFRVSRV